MSKICACIILNDFFKINFFSGIYWRYLYYWKQYSYDQLLMIVLEGKKKIPASEFALAIGVAAMMKDTILTMTTKEANSYLQELILAQEAHSNKNSLKQ